MTRLRAIIHDAAGIAVGTDPPGLVLGCAYLVLDGEAFTYPDLGKLLIDGTRANSLAGVVGQFVRRNNKMVGSVYAPAKDLPS